MDFKYLPNPRIPPPTNSAEQQAYVNSLIAQHQSLQSQIQPQPTTISSAPLNNTPANVSSSINGVMLQPAAPPTALLTNVNVNTAPTTNQNTPADTNVSSSATSVHSNSNIHNHQNHFFNTSNIDPFDFSNYPLTNPPIFDSTMMLNITNDGILRRRRISISNGQIGQLVSHEYDDDEPYNDIVQPNFNQNQNMNQNMNSMNMSQLNSQVSNQINQMGSLSMNASDSNVKHSGSELSGQQSSANTTNGIPNHQLIYNNEVIFNPNNGPIPGTAAWKRQILLERNRIAASKCRQRKKQAQQQLQKNSEKYQIENKKLVRKVEFLSKTLNKFKTVMEKHLVECSGNSLSLKILNDFVYPDENDLKDDEDDDDDDDVDEDESSSSKKGANSSFSEI